MESKKKYTVEDSVHVKTTSTVQSSAAQARTYFNSKTPIPNNSSKASITSPEAPKHQNTMGKKVETTNMKAVSRHRLVNTLDAIESTEPSQRDTKPAESDVPGSPPVGKPLRERQLLPLPHFGQVIPPPADFAGYSGKGETTLTRDSNRGYCMDALKWCQIYWIFSQVFKTFKRYIIFVLFFTSCAGILDENSDKQEQVLLSTSSTIYASSNALYVPLATMTVPFQTSSTLRRRNLKNATISGDFSNIGQETIVTPSFTKASVFKMFSVKTKTQKFLQFDERFRKVPFL